MITTNSFPNTITSSEIKELKYNTLSKESLEGKAKKNYLDHISINGGTCQNIKFGTK